MAEKIKQNLQITIADHKQEKNIMKKKLLLITLACASINIYASENNVKNVKRNNRSHDHIPTLSFNKAKQKAQEQKEQENATKKKMPKRNLGINWKKFNSAHKIIALHNKE